ncbi:MAG TPA: hypothetical protein VM841_04285 [Actinomycetota bacterium]|nr:hypothetical protein [Actinomycetota bacterium]
MLPLSRPISSRVLAVCLILAAFGSAACSGSPAGSDEVVQLAFQDSVEVVAAGDAEPPAEARDQGGAIVGLITEWYQRAFVDPAGWRDEKFPDVVRLFSGEARTKVKREIESVTIGDARDEVRSVKPEDATVKVTVYVGEDGRTDYAVADVSFHGTGALKKEGVPLTIVQKATYFFRLESDGWRIFAYQARSDHAQNPPPGATS